VSRFAQECSFDAAVGQDADGGAWPRPEFRRRHGAAPPARARMPQQESRPDVPLIVICMSGLLPE